MKKLIKQFKAFPVIFILLFFALLYLPAALVAPAESNKFAIVNAVGIDYDSLCEKIARMALNKKKK